jgi:hypothetical protein
MIEEYRTQYSEFNEGYQRELYLFYSGQKPTLEIAPIYERYDDLFRKDAIDQITKELERTPEQFETSRKSLGHFLAFAVEHFLENSVKHLTEQVNEYESSAKIEIDGRLFTFNDAAVAVATESNREYRRRIHSGRASVIERSNDLRAQRLEKLHAAARLLGHANYRALFESIRQIDYASVAARGTQLLSETDAAFTATIADSLRGALGISLEEAERPDAVYFLHFGRYDSRFPAEKLLPVYRETMAGLGIDTDQQKRVLIDSEPRPLKAARAFCLPVSVPDEVKLVIRPSGGQSDYQALLHESGHAQHYGWTSQHLAAEFKYTGDAALTETYAFLFNHLVTDPDWLAEFMQFESSETFIRSALLGRLLTIRRYAAKLNYEIQLHGGIDLAAAPSIYAESQTAATRFRTSAIDFLYDLDDGFYAAGYLRAWASEVLLREHLRSRFGRKWWSSRRAGTLLKELWETGDLYTADEMIAQMGLGPISFDPLIAECNRALR